MSKCISSHGEYSMHTLDDGYICAWCGALDEDALTADRDAAVARAKQAEQAVARVRELLARWEHTPGRMSQVDVLRRALDGTP